jgi:ATP-dependent HslUV protease ATP-binding subunit HslU
MMKNLNGNLTPTQTVAELDKYIIGQDDAKRAVAIALRNRWRRQQVEADLRDEIMPNNIILIGPTGVGKTEIARRLAKLSNAPFIKVEASKFTEVGYVGRDVESMIRDLTDIAINMVNTEKKKEVQKKADELAEERILDILIPPVKRTVSTPVNSEEEVTSEAEKESLQNEKTREWMKEKLKKGEMDEKMIEFDISAPQVGVQVMGPMGMDDMGMNIQEIVSSMMPKKKKKRKTTIENARKLLSQEEAQKLIDMEAVQTEAIRRVQETGMVFIDEIDKVAGGGSESRGGPDVSREGVQRDLLPIVEGSAVNTKYGTVKTDHILFIASGAFHIAKPSDLIPELQGRFPIRVELKSLTEEDFIKILTIPENALLKQYCALLKTEGVIVKFSDEAISEVARTAAYVNEEVENIGARRLHTILTTLLEDILFDLPDKMDAKNIEIDGKLVKTKLDAIVKDRDLSKYIL